jgi:D-3-phosphoglycerate dehydrogenase
MKTSRNTIKVVVTDCPFESLDVETSILEPLGCDLLVRKTAPPVRELAELTADADHVLTVFAPVNADVIATMKKAKVIVRYGVGVDNVDLEAARTRGIPVCNVPDYCMDEVADHTLALMLAVTRQIVVNANAVRGGQWGLIGPLSAMKTLSGLTVGVVGFGRIGREVVRRLLAFKCRVLVHDPALSDDEIRRHGVEPTSFLSLLRSSDVVTLHCPATSQTRGVMNQQTLAAMKPGAILINCGRGTLVDSDALVDTLTRKHLAAAGLDVFDPEPLPKDSPLRQMDNVILTSHVAAVSEQAIRRLRETAAGIVAKAIRGERLPNVVNEVTQ